jgi:hypothetical protein
MKGLDAEVVARCLEDGGELRDPSDAARATLAALTEAGLVLVSWTRGFPCHGPEEDEDPDRPDTFLCGGWVDVPDAWPEGPQPDEEDEDALDAWLAREVDFECRRCTRIHQLDRYPRTVRDRASKRLQVDATGAWMAERLIAMDSDARPLRFGVGWRLLLGEDEVAVVWLDQSQDTRATTRAFGAAQPTVYVTTEPRHWSARFRDEPNVVVLRLADWLVGGDGVLREAAARASQRPLFVAEPGLRPWAHVRSPEPLVLPQPLGARVLVVEEARATVDGVEVLGRDARGVLPLLSFLVDRWREDVADSKAPADHCTWSPEDILTGLRDTGVVATDSPATVRRQVSRLRSGIVRRYLEATGVTLDEDAVVQNIAGQGYRIHPAAVVARRG